MIVTFCGHKDTHDRDGSIQVWLTKTVESLILRGANLFYLSGYGGFDSMAACVVKGMKAKYPEIRSILVVPYIDRKPDMKLYDDATYPPLENVPRRFAISKRNQWMVENSDVVVAYVVYTWGGAIKTLEHAMRKKKEIIRYLEAQDNGK